MCKTQRQILKLNKTTFPAVQCQYTKQMICTPNAHPPLISLHHHLSLLHVSLQELLAAFEAEATKTNRPRLMLTAAVSAGKATIDAGYEIAKIGASV